MTHRKWKEIKQQPSMLPGLAVPGSCLVSFYFRWAIHPIRPVQGDHGGLTLDCIDFNSGVPQVCSFAVTSLPNFCLPKQNWAGRRPKQLKVNKTQCETNMAWSPCSLVNYEEKWGVLVRGCLCASRNLKRDDDNAIVYYREIIHPFHVRRPPSSTKLSQSLS